MDHFENEWNNTSKLSILIFYFIFYFCFVKLQIQYVYQLRCSQQSFQYRPGIKQTHCSQKQGIDRHWNRFAWPHPHRNQSYLGQRVCLMFLILFPYLFFLLSCLTKKKRFNLPIDAVHSGLPLIDTKHTAIAQFCPAKYLRQQCKVQRYREVDGMCNNLENPHWGATMAAFRHLIPPSFRDGN